jgi:hypothetical protein
MVFNTVSPPRVININRALAPTPLGVTCCICGSNKVYHIGGIKDFFLCFKCHTRLIVKKEERK